MGSPLSRSTLGLIALTALGYGMAYLRDTGIAAIFGASRATDAFFAGTFPAMVLYTALIVGSFVPAMIPVLTRLGEGQISAWTDALGVCCRWLVWSLVVLVLAAELFAEPVLSVLAPGFDTGLRREAGMYLRLCMPMLVFLGPASVAAASLNTRRNFLTPGLGSVAFSGITLGSLVLASAWGLWVVALGMVLGGAAQVAVNLAALTPAERHVIIRLSGHDTSAARRTLTATVSLFGFTAFTQALPLVERFYASRLPSGTLSHFAYATKIYTLPVSIVAISFVSVLLPVLSLYSVQVDADGFGRQLRHSFGQLLVTIVPLSACIWLFAPLIIGAAFQRGSFNAADSGATASLLQVYSLAVLPLCMNLLLARAYSALGRMLEPVLFAGGAALLYVSLAGPMLDTWGPRGLALCLALSSGAMALGLAINLIWRLRPATIPGADCSSKAAGGAASHYARKAPSLRRWSDYG